MGQTIPFTQPTSEPGEVVVRGDTVVIANLIEHDGELAAFVGDAPDPVEATHQCLRLGARAARAVQLTVDTGVVERRFDDLAERFDRGVAEAVENLSEVTHALLDSDDGALTGTLNGHRTALESLLGATFDPDSKKSVIAIFDKIMRAAHAEQQAALGRLVSIDGDDSPLNRLKRDLTREVKDQLGEVKGELKEISEKIAVSDAVAPVIELTSAKGFTFEDVLDSRLCHLAAMHGDLAERTGSELGSAANKKGDEVVTLCREDTPGGEGRVVLEAKTRGLTMRATMKELDESMLNRDAQVAIAVFSSQTLAPTTVPFYYSENKAVVVLDKDGTDDSALRLAYMWARWVVRRTVGAVAGSEFDPERISRLIDDARRAIERATTIRGSHTKAKKAIDQAGEQLDDLASEVSRALGELHDELGSAA